MYNVKYLVNGIGLYRTCKEYLIKATEFNIDKINGDFMGREEEQKNSVDLVVIFIYSFTMMVIETVLFTYLFDYDFYKYPTIICIILTWLPLFKKSIAPKNNDLDGLIVYKAKLTSTLNDKRTKYGTMSAVIHTAYYIYILQLISTF
jgi:hypothetical protein